MQALIQVEVFIALQFIHRMDEHVLEDELHRNQTDEHCIFWFHLGGGFAGSESMLKHESF